MRYAFTLLALAATTTTAWGQSGTRNAIPSQPAPVQSFGSGTRNVVPSAPAVSGSGTRNAIPTPSYAAPSAPVYSAPPTYSAPAPTYSAPAATYAAPPQNYSAPVYSSPMYSQPIYRSPSIFNSSPAYRYPSGSSFYAPRYSYPSYRSYAPLYYRSFGGYGGGCR